MSAGRAVLALGLLLAPAACGAPPQAGPGQTLGFGTPGVETYAPPDRPVTLTALRDRCQTLPEGATPPRPQTLAAACDQLRRTLHNQPGSSLAR